MGAAKAVYEETQTDLLKSDDRRAVLKLQRRIRERNGQSGEGWRVPGCPRSWATLACLTPLWAFAHGQQSRRSGEEKRDDQANVGPRLRDCRSASRASSLRLPVGSAPRGRLLTRSHNGAQTTFGLITATCPLPSRFRKLTAWPYQEGCESWPETPGFKSQLTWAVEAWQGGHSARSRLEK